MYLFINYIEGEIGSAYFRRIKFDSLSAKNCKKFFFDLETLQRAFFSLGVLYIIYHSKTNVFR